MTGVPLNIDWQQILLHLFNFTILFGALYILLYKPVKDFMAQREEHFAEMESKAGQALADAEKNKEEYEKKLRLLTTYEDNQEMAERASEIVRSSNLGEKEAYELLSIIKKLAE
jgi:F-type H+-transporting ATPase subunit b